MKTLNYTYRNLRLETACNNIFIKFKMSRNPLLERDSCSLILASDNQMLAFWAVTYVRFNCISFISAFFSSGDTIVHNASLFPANSRDRKSRWYFLRLQVKDGVLLP